MNNKPSDRKIIMSLYKETNSENLKWYISLFENNIETWRAKQKLTENKSIIYSIYYNKIDNLQSKMDIYLEKIIDGKFNMIKIQNINSTKLIFFLFKNVLKKSNYKVIERNYAIIENYDNSKILLLKNNILSLPYLINQSINFQDTLKKYINYQTNINIENMNNFHYRNIINIDDFYFYINLYVSNTKDDNLKNSMWVSKKTIESNDQKIQNILKNNIDEISLNVIKFYIDNSLPF
jgi:hypothetical protein